MERTTTKTYGAWKVTEAEYLEACRLSEGDGPLAANAWQVVRYCRGAIFNRDQAAEAIRLIRNASVGLTSLN